MLVEFNWSNIIPLCDLLRKRQRMSHQYEGGYEIDQTQALRLLGAFLFFSWIVTRLNWIVLDSINLLEVSLNLLFKCRRVDVEDTKQVFFLRIVILTYVKFVRELDSWLLNLSYRGGYELSLAGVFK